MRGLLTSGVAALGFLAAATAANAETVTVAAISNSPAAIGNVVIISSSAQIKATASSGAVSFPSGTAVRIKTSGVSPTNLPVQTVTVSCNTGGGGNCKHVYRVLVTSAGVTGQATAVSAVNFSNPSTTDSITFSALSGEAAPSGTTALFTADSNSTTFSFTFRIGATASVTAAGTHAASWSYNVRVVTP